MILCPLPARWGSSTLSFPSARAGSGAPGGTTARSNGIEIVFVPSAGSGSAAHGGPQMQYRTGSLNRTLSLSRAGPPRAAISFNLRNSSWLALLERIVGSPTQCSRFRQTPLKPCCRCSYSMTSFDDVVWPRIAERVKDQGSVVWDSISF